MFYQLMQCFRLKDEMAGDIPCHVADLRSADHLLTGIDHVVLYEGPQDESAVEARAIASFLQYIKPNLYGLIEFVDGQQIRLVVLEGAKYALVRNRGPINLQTNGNGANRERVAC